MKRISEIPANQDAAQIAREIQQRIKTEIELDCTVAVSSNKLVSKVACNTVKPRGFIVVHRARNENFLRRYRLANCLAQAKSRARNLNKWNVQTIGDLAKFHGKNCAAELGKWGIYLHEAALGMTIRRSSSSPNRNRLVEENTFECDTRNAEQIEKLFD